MFKEISHEEFRWLSEPFTLGYLDPVQRGRFRQHAKNCSECAEWDSHWFAEQITEKGLGWAFQDMPATPEERWIQRHCLSDLTIDEYNKGALTDEEERVVNKHLYDEECDYCLAAIHDNALLLELEAEEENLDSVH